MKEAGGGRGGGLGGGNGQKVLDLVGCTWPAGRCLVVRTDPDVPKAPGALDLLSPRGHDRARCRGPGRWRADHRRGPSFKRGVPDRTCGSPTAGPDRRGRPRGWQVSTRHADGTERVSIGGGRAAPARGGMIGEAGGGNLAGSAPQAAARPGPCHERMLRAVGPRRRVGPAGPGPGWRQASSGLGAAPAPRGSARQAWCSPRLKPGDHRVRGRRPPPARTGSATTTGSLRRPETDELLRGARPDTGFLRSKGKLDRGRHVRRSCATSSPSGCSGLPPPRSGSNKDVPWKDLPR